MPSLKRYAAAAILGLATIAIAQSPAKYCPSTAKDTCFSVAVPETAASSGAGDLYFQISAPVDGTSWVALGQGAQMSGSNIFVVYTNEKGDNVTLSPRLGKGHVEPEYDQAEAGKVMLLEGSGVKDGMMTANVRCSSCQTWPGGHMDISSSNTAWIWAMSSGSALASDSPDEEIKKHSDKDAFTLDLTKAKSSNSLNPFIAASPASSTNTAGVAGSTQLASSKSGADDQVEGASGSGHQKQYRVLVAHGVLMSLAFVIFFPTGAVLIRLLGRKGGKTTVWIHSGTQFFTLLMAIAGMGLGIWLVKQDGEKYNQYHPVIGLTVIAALFIQLILGHLHHILYMKKHVRTFWADAHVWWGRAALTLGIINGGLGLRWAGNTKAGEIVYGVVAAVVWLAWMSVGAWNDITRSKNRGVEGEKHLLRNGNASKMESHPGSEQATRRGS